MAPCLKRIWSAQTEVSIFGKWQHAHTPSSQPDFRWAFRFDASLQMKALAKTSPSGTTAATVAKWTKALPLPDRLKKSVDEFLCTSAQTFKNLPKEERANIKDRAVEFGLPFAAVSAMKDTELFKCIAAGHAMSLASQR